MKRIKVAALVEAHVVTGPAKNILRFALDCRERVDLTIVTFLRQRRSERKEGSPNEFIAAARRLGIPVEIVRESGRFDLSVLDRLRVIFRDQKTDIVQTHGIKSHFLVSLLRRRAFRWIAFHHGYTTEDLKMRMYCQFDRWSLRHCDSLVTVCTEFSKLLARRGASRDRIYVVPNSIAIDSSEVAASGQIRQRLRIADNERVVLTVGRLSSEKGHRYLIDAVSKIISESPGMNLIVLIAGTGPIMKKLKGAVQKYGLDQRIKFIGYYSDVRALFSIADLFVLPSLSEGSPNVLLESMAARVPIVATNVGGVPELVSDGESALLVPPSNGMRLAKSMTEMLADKSRASRLADAAFDRARLLFDPARYDERILNIYALVMHDPAA
jgi:glycosyltransferase involved in cell wall biosynthesis